MTKVKEVAAAETAVVENERTINHLFEKVMRIKPQGFSRTPAVDYTLARFEVVNVSRKRPSKPFVELLIKRDENTGESFWFGLSALAALDNSPIVEVDDKFGIDESMLVTWNSSMSEPAFRPAN
jgi:hypothetical protein